MASIREYKNKKGEIRSCLIRVFMGVDYNGNQVIKSMTWKVPPGIKKSDVRKKAEEAAAEFEKACKNGDVYDNRMRFCDYAQECLDGLFIRQASYETIEDYKERLVRINKEIGYLRLVDIRPKHLNDFYRKLLSEGSRINSERAYVRVDLKQLIKDKKMTMKQVSDRSGISDSTLRDAVHGKALKVDTADKIAAALDVDRKEIFEIVSNNKPLSCITVLGYHRVISAILGQAVKEGIIKDNPASRASPPPESPEKEANYFQPEEVIRVLEALDNEPLFWRVMVHLMIITGVRRGEVLALTWADIDFERCKLSIKKSVSSTKEKGIYEHAPKTRSSRRYVGFTETTLNLLLEYKRWYESECDKYGIHSEKQYLFAILGEKYTGLPCHPSSINHYLITFSKKYGLPHINPHAFRHSYASMMMDSNVDLLKVSYSMGHAKISTTNKYAHIFRDAERAPSEAISNVLFNNHQKNKG